MRFFGFPEAAFDFYDDLEVDNSKSFWDAHKAVYIEAIKDPITALVAELEPEFGAAKVFRPYRDVRFAKDKTAYKTHQGAYVEVRDSTGYYVQIGAPGVRVGVGFYYAEGEALRAYRDAVAGPDGAELEKMVKRMTKAGWEVGGEALKTSPRGYPADHPRIDLLRHKALTFGRDYGFDKVVHTPDLVDKVRQDWRKGRPFVEWALAHLHRS